MTCINVLSLSIQRRQQSSFYIINQSLQQNVIRCTPLPSGVIFRRHLDTYGLSNYCGGHLSAYLTRGPQCRLSASDQALFHANLDDDSVSPLAIRRLVQRHPDNADRVFRTLLRKPAFSWAQDGENLLRRRKKTHVDREPLPSVSTVGERLAELLRTR